MYKHVIYIEHIYYVNNYEYYLLEYLLQQQQDLLLYKYSLTEGMFDILASSTCACIIFVIIVKKRQLQISFNLLPM